MIVPVVARARHKVLLQKLAEFREAAKNSPYNTISGQGEVGCIATGVSRAYLRDALEDLGLPGLLPGRRQDGRERIAVQRLHGLRADLRTHHPREKELTMSRLRVFFTGVGGQGTVTATRLLAQAALDEGLPVRP